MSELEKLLSTGFLVPMGDPNSPSCRWGLNMMLWGVPGIGKSERIEMAAAMLGIPARTTYVPTCQPEDASGSPFVNTSKGMAFFESVLFTLEKHLDKKKSSDWRDIAALQAESNWFDRMIGHTLGEFGRELVTNLAKTARRYGSSFSRIEPMLPGLSELIMDGQGVWFLDEISSARPALQGGFLGAVLTKRVGGIQLPPGIRTVAAGNPADSAAGGWDMEPPMANRWCHFNVDVPTDDQWTNYLNDSTTSLESIEDGEKKIREGWNDNWAIVRGLVTGFRATKASPLLEIPAEGSPERGRAWPSPRTWYFATRAFCTCRCLYGKDGDKLAMEFAEGCVGKAAATPFASWLLNSDLPHPQDVLDNGWLVDKKRIDRCAAVYASIVNWTLGRTDPKERHDLAVKVWKRLHEANQANLLDLTYKHAKAMIRHKFDADASPDLEEVVQPVMARLAKSPIHQIVTSKP